MENQNIEINPSDDNFKGISHSKTFEKENEDNSDKNKLKGFFNKVKTMKNMIPSLNKENKNENKQNEIKIASSQEVEEEKTYKDKIKDFLISKIEVDRNILVFLALLGSGILLLIFSLIFIPTIIISPAKFSMCFSLGSLLFLISFLFLYGTKKYMEKIFSKERFWITIMFIVSILIGCGFAIGKNYLISLICSIFQFISLILFILTFLPGGKLGIKCIKDLLTSPVSKLWMKMAESQINQ